MALLFPFQKTLLGVLRDRVAVSPAVLICTLAAAVSGPSARAQSGDAAPTLTASRVEGGAVSLDGRLDEAMWGQAPAATGFVQKSPTPGAAATQATEARVLYDGSAVYVGVRMHDTDAAAIAAPLGRRGATLSTDEVFVVIDSYHDRRTAFLFGVNPAGVKADALLYDDTREDASWDAVWSVATSRDSAGWTAEFRIPLSQLRYASGAGEQTWGIQFGRTVQRTGERSYWSPILPSENRFVSRFGALTGLVGLGAPRRLEVVPYAAAQATRAPDARTPGGPADPYYASTDAALRAGLDLKLGLSSTLTLAATVNPDFGQVEADPAQVNLGGFELFLNERRPFFVEGADVFSIGTTRANSTSNRPTLLYTRRIGRSPQRQGFVPGSVTDSTSEQGVVYTDAPQQTTILGAAKVSGRVGRVTLGVLTAVTANEYGRYTAFDGTGAPLTDGRGLVEPLSSYSVARARVTVGRTLLGAAGTLVVRDLSDPAFPARMPRQASVLEADVEHRGASGWIVSGVLAGSAVTGSRDAIAGLQTAFPRLYQRPDARYLAVDSTRTGLFGLTGELALTKSTGVHWRGSLSGAFTSPGFDSNELGYQSRADFGSVNAFLAYSEDTPRAWYRSWSAYAFGVVGSNFGGDLQNTVVGGQILVNLASFWSARVNASVDVPGTDDRKTRGGPIALDPLGVDLSFTVGSDTRRPVSGFATVSGGASEIGTRILGVETGLDLRPATNLTFGLYPGLSAERNARQYATAFDAPEAVTTFGRRTIFAEASQAEFSATARVDWTFTPDLSLQLYARPFVSRGRYDVFKQVTASRQLDFPTVEEAGGQTVRNGDGSVTITPGDGGAPYTLRPDITVRAVQGNAVLRWEYRPGSTLFFVWQQQRSGAEPDGRFQLGRNLSRLATDALTNVFLVKLTYWFG